MENKWFLVVFNQDGVMVPMLVPFSDLNNGISSYFAQVSIDGFTYDAEVEYEKNESEVKFIGDVSVYYYDTDDVAYFCKIEKVVDFSL